MSVEIVQNADSSMGLRGDITGGNGGFIPVNVAYVAGSVATSSVFTANRNYVVQDISGRVDVVGTGGACTLSLYAVPSGVAIASGTLLHSGTYNLVGTINTKQTLTLSVVSGALNIANGGSIGYVITGTATSAVGSLTITLNPST
jgi:hypothetical protein